MKRLSRTFKDPVSGLTHVASAAAALAGAVGLWRFSPPDAGTRFGMVVYGASLVLMFVTSSTCHLVAYSG